jgi:MFS family permease
LASPLAAVVHASRQYHNQLIAALTLSVLISYADRTNMSLTVLEMMRELGLVDPKTNIVEPDKEGILLAAFFCGYIVTQVPGGWAAQVWGGRRVLAVGSVIWSVCTFLIPLATTAGFWWVVLLRVGLGLGEGVCFPSIHVLVSRWVPESEKSRAVAIITAGAYLGNIVAIGVSGELIRSPYFGWRYAFYIFGIFGLVWNFGWHFFARHEHEHPTRPTARRKRRRATPATTCCRPTTCTPASSRWRPTPTSSCTRRRRRRHATAAPVVESAPSVEDRLIPADSDASGRPRRRFRRAPPT